MMGRMEPWTLQEEEEEVVQWWVSESGGYLFCPPPPPLLVPCRGPALWSCFVVLHCFVTLQAASALRSTEYEQ